MLTDKSSNSFMLLRQYLNRNHHSTKHKNQTQHYIQAQRSKKSVEFFTYLIYVCYQNPENIKHHHCET